MRALMIVGLLAWAGVAQAQVHPCDQPEQTTATKGTRIGWCVSAEDVTIPTWTLKVSAVLALVYDGLSPLGAPSSAGLYYFEAPLPTGYGRGTYPVAVYGTSEEGDGPDSDVKLWQVGGRPGKPQKPRVTGGA